MSSYDAIDRLCAEFGLSVLSGEPMSRHTSFRIGGPADRFVTVENRAQLTALLDCAGESNLPVFLLGNGSDLLVSDEGFRGLVLTLGGEFKEITRRENSIRAGAGVSLASLCNFAREQGLSGLEFAWGIPGSVGGAVMMNAGAYGGEMKDVLSAVTHLEKASGRTVTLPGEELELSYRHSRYQGRDDVILYAEFSLQPGRREEISARMNELMARRKEKQPYDLPSGGSVFKRPVGGYAAALIDECGLKGLSRGGAQVSPKHAGFIVNNGSATCADVLELVKIIQETVFRQKQIRLELELELLGREGGEA